MQLDGSIEPLEGVHPESLLPGETILQHWPAPGGRGALTNLRCLLLSHPHPVHRVLRWEVDLEQVYRLMVEEVKGRPGLVAGIRGPFGGGSVSTGKIDMTLCVIVDRTIVYIGDPNPCGDLQRYIDEARTARCLSVYGRLLPYHPGPPTKADPGNEVDAGDEAAPTSPQPARGDAPALILFLAGEPFRDADPMHGRTLFVANMVGGSATGSDTAGGHQAADFQPGQIYGAQAETGRLVLDLARKCEVRVKVVDVNNPGADLDLVKKWVSPDDDLPILLRSDGTRIQGEESMVPLKIAEFLQAG